MAPPPTRRFRHGLHEGTAGDGATLLEALADGRLPSVVRSVRYHRPRAPYCGTGDCTGCLVRVNGRPNVRACRHRVADGDRVDRGNGWPSAEFDLLGLLDGLFPAGIDTLHGFRRPAWARGLYHQVIRRLAGYAAAPDPAAAAALAEPPRRIDVDVAVIGGGPAGTAAARRLVERGRRPLLIDRALDASPVSGAESLPGTTATFVPPPDSGSDRPFTVLGFEEPGRGVAIRSRALIVATGSYDGPLLFEGNDRPGVVTAELALRFARTGRRSPLRRAVVVGGGARALEALDRLGSTVVGVVAPTEIGPEVARRASELDVPLYPRTLVLRARGRARVRAIELRPRGSGPTFSLTCDAVVLAVRRLPQGQLVVQAGATVDWHPEPGGYVARIAPGGATTVPGLYVAGSVAGDGGAGAAESGTRAADSALENAPPVPSAGELPVPPPGELEGYYRELLREPRRGKWVACPCEDVLLEEVERAVDRGYSGIEVVKRYTGLGTGLCQGRFCLPDALLVLAILERRAAREVGRITQRPPAVPTPLAALAALADADASEVVP